MEKVWQTMEEIIRIKIANLKVIMSADVKEVFKKWSIDKDTNGNT